jgi:hypothetical protein
VVAAAPTGNWNIKMVAQSAQSPDTNQLDLTFLRALQPSQWDNSFASEIDGLLDCTISDTCVRRISPSQDRFWISHVAVLS